MRASLKQSLKDSPAGSQDDFRYPAGSLVLCNACAKPVAKLEYGIAFGDKAGRTAKALKPLNAADVTTLADRDDIDAGVRAWAKSMTPDARIAYLGKLKEFKSGDPMSCPLCEQCFVQVLSVEKDEVLDRAYVIELVTLPPQGHHVLAVRGLKIGANKAWVHEGAELI